MPGRFKDFNYYNAGAVLDFLMTIIRPMLSKKIQERVRYFCNYSNMPAFSVTKVLLFVSAV